MKIFTTWQQPATKPSSALPIDASTSAYARPHTCGVTAPVAGAVMGDLRLDAVRIKGVFPGSPVWSPLIS